MKKSDFVHWGHVPPPKSVLPANPKTTAHGMPFFGKATSADYGDFKGLKEKPIQLDNHLFKSRNPLGVNMPFFTKSLYEDSFMPFKINPDASKEPQLQKITDPRPRYDGEFDLEYQKHDGARHEPTDKGPRKCCHVLASEKTHMLASSAVRMLHQDPGLASQVLDPQVLTSST